MSAPYDLTKLGPKAFEHLVNFLTLKVLGAGASGFGPGADGGRDGYFEGEAAYPSAIERWSGVWYIQSKFHEPHLSISPQDWLISQIKKEIDAFEGRSRTIPDNFIVATNIDPSGVAQTGAFDRANKLVRDFSKRKGKKINFGIWGGSKIINLLMSNKDAYDYYAHFITPGHVLSLMYEHLSSLAADLQTIIEYLVVSQFGEYQYMKLDQAGSSSDNRPGIHDLFIDVPFAVENNGETGFLLSDIAVTASQCHRYSLRSNYPQNWLSWASTVRRARTIVIKGGPGQGKSTAGQYLAQIQRAALILESEKIKVIDKTIQRAKDIERVAKNNGLWPERPRIPVAVELKEFAQWYGERNKGGATNVLAFVAHKIQRKLDQSVSAAVLKRALSSQSWLIIFDGLDEVPNGIKDSIAKEIICFANEAVISSDADILTICTSRPQGYSGQFSELDGPVLYLSKLDPASALRCAEPVVGLDRTLEERDRSMEVLKAALASESVQELMTTPLQAHIMAVVVRDGGRPPERRWQLFDNFYQVMKKRESLKNFPNHRIAKLLREDDRLLKAVHARLGFVLHARAEQSEGAETHLSRLEFKSIVTQAVKQMEEPSEVDSTVAALMEATTERLVLVSTPESGEQVKFDIRQLQEFFAAEFIYRDVPADELGQRLAVVCGDAHWREVMHFLLSGLFETGRTSEIAVAISSLDFLDNGEEVEVAALFRRRMARGALLAARLLAEGVLEQDKRRRQQLRSVLRPIAAIADRYTCKVLEQVNPQNSRVWLTDFLVSLLDEASSTESVAAIAILGRILPGGHSKEDRVICAFLDLPVAMLELVVQAWSIAGSEEHHLRGASGSSSLVPWAHAALIKFLSLPKSLQVNQDALYTLLNRVGGSAEMEIALEAAMLGPGQRTAIDLLSQRDGIHQRGSRGPRSVVDYGVVVGTHFYRDWVTGEKSSPAKIKKVASMPASHGIFEMMRLLCHFVCTRELASLNAAINLVGAENIRVIRALPLEISRYLPIDACRPLLFSNYKFSDNGIVEPVIPFSNQPGGKPVYEYEFGQENLDEKKWDAFVRDVPVLAMKFWFGLNVMHVAHNKRIAMPSWVYSAENAEKILSICEEMPSEAVRHILAWGKMIKINDSYRKRLRSVAARGRKSFSGGQWNVNSDPYEIYFPEDIDIVGLLAPSLIYAISDAKRYGMVEGRRTTLEQFLDAVHISGASLKEMVADETLDMTMRSAALGWLLLQDCHKESRSSVEERQQLLARTDCLVGKGEGFLLLPVVLYWLGNRCLESTPGVPELLGRLLYIFKDNSKALLDIHHFLGDLREYSSEPIHRSQVIEAWLAYSWDE